MVTAICPVGLGFRAQRGGSVVVGVTIDQGEPRVLLSTFLATAADGDRLAFEPYHVAAEMAGGRNRGAIAQAAAAVADGRKRQDALAVVGLEAVARTVRSQGCDPVVAALLVNRAGWVTDLLEYSLAFADHPPVAEGLAVRDALRFAFGALGLPVAEIDEKSLPRRAAEALGRAPAAIDAQLKALGATAGKPWRKEQKLACLGAWVAVAAR